MTRAALLLAVLALTACSREQAVAPAAQPVKPPEPAPVAQAPVAPAPAVWPLVQPPEPGTPGGLPDDRTPISEAPFTPQSAQGASNVVQTYFAHLGQKNYIAAWALWADGGRASGSATPDAFRQTFAKYAQYDALSGAPGSIEGAAGSLFVTVPVVIYGRLTTGAEVHEKGEATLRRVNNVDGSTPEQRRWHIEKIETKPSPG